MDGLSQDRVKPNEEPVQGEGLLGQTAPVGEGEGYAYPMLEGVVAEGKAHLEQAEKTAGVGLGDTLSAAVQQQDTWKLGYYAIKKLSGDIERFPHDPDFDLEEYLLHNKVKLTKSEREWVRNRNPNSTEEADQYMDTITKDRDLAAISQVNPFSSFLATSLDAVYALPVGGALKLARVANMGRVGTALTGAGGEVGVMGLATTQRPVDNVEFALSLILGGAANLAFTPRNTQALMRRADRELDWLTGQRGEFADAEFRRLDLEVTNMVNATTEFADVPKMRKVEVGGKYQYLPERNLIRETKRGVVDVPAIREETLRVSDAEAALAVKGKRTSGTPSRNVHTELQRILDSNGVPELVRATAQQLLDLGGDALKHVPVRYSSNKRGKYSTGDHTITLGSRKKDYRKLNPESLQTLVHEAAHSMTAFKYNLGEYHHKKGWNTTHAKLYNEFNTLFNSVKEAATKYGIPNNHYIKNIFKDPYEFMAMLYTGRSDVFKYLQELSPHIELGGKTLDRPLVGEMYDSVRRLLGMDLEQAGVLARALALTEDYIKMPVEYRYDYTTGKQTVHRLRVPETPAQVATRTEQQVNQMAQVGTEVDKVRANITKESIGGGLAWNLFKDASKIDPEFASKWLSDPLRSNAGNNITASKRAVRAELEHHEVRYHQALREYLYSQGLKPWEIIVRWKKVREAQVQAHRDIQKVLADWDNKSSQGIAIEEIDTPLHRVAKAYDDAMVKAAEVGIGAGIFTEALARRRGYFPRTFDSFRIGAVETRLAKLYDGDVNAGRAHLARELSKNFREMRGIDSKLSLVIAHAILDRARRQGELQDLTFRGHMGLEVLAAVRDEMTRQGASKGEIRRVANLLEGKVKEKGKASYQKNRLDINMDGVINLGGGKTIKVIDLIESDITLGMRNYLDDLSGRVAMSEHGIESTVDIDKARQAFVASAKTKTDRLKAQRLFDNTVNDVLGRPVGEHMHTALRYVHALTQMVSLRNTGFWQITEFAPMMQRYGALHGQGTMIREVFGSWANAKKFLDNPENAGHLASILSHNAWNNTRWQPFIEKLDDGHSVNPNTFLGGVLNAQQYVYVANGMRYVMRRQSMASANLITHSLEQATKGHTKSIEFFRKYGIDDATLQRVGTEFRKHGWEVDRWDNTVWADIRAPLMTIVDEDVLRARTGEIPEVAQFSTVGRAMFTFRNFVLTSHNKILAGGIANDGGKAMALVFAYQLALSMMMVQLANVAAGNGVGECEDLPNKSVCYMVRLGLFAEFT